MEHRNVRPGTGNEIGRTSPLNDEDSADTFMIYLTGANGSVPLTFAAAIMTLLGHHFPRTSTATPRPGTALALRVHWSDLHQWSDRRELESPARTVVEAMNEYDDARIRAVCDALGEPFETPDGHGSRSYTWAEVLDLIRARNNAWRDYLGRIEQVDPEWLDKRRRGQT